MYRTILLIFTVVTLAVCGGKSYSITLFGPALVGGNELKAGDYRVQVVDQNAVISHGKTEVRVPVKQETVKDKYSDTSIRTNLVDGKSRLVEIRLGGTNTKLVVVDQPTNSGSE